MIKTTYIPMLLKDANGNKLYQFGQIDSWNSISDSNYSASPKKGKFNLWFPYWKSNLYISREIREALYPSTMVDDDGNLWALTLYSFNHAQYGPSFQLVCYKGNGSKKFYQTYYLWNKNLGANGSFGETPNFSGLNDTYKAAAQYVIINDFSPVIAQEVFGSDITSENKKYLYIFATQPTAKYCNCNASSPDARLIAFKINKSNGNIEKVTRIKRGEDGGVLDWNRTPKRMTAASHYYQPVVGILKAAYNGKTLQVYHIATKTARSEAWDNMTAVEPSIVCGKIYNTEIGCPSRINVSGLDSTTSEGHVILPRFQQIGDKTYFMCIRNGSNQSLAYFKNDGSTTTDSTTVKCTSTYCSKLESSSSTSETVRYSGDFCILPNGSNPIVCTLGFKYGLGLGGSNEISWVDSNIVCVLCSTPLSNINWKTCRENVIYTTTIKGGNGSATRPASSLKTSQLCLNTQMFVPYTAASGRTYIIYAYCYPGESTQLHFGCAPYHIQDNEVILDILYETLPFDNFTSCRRIITMDLKAGHLWITFVDADCTGFFRFHMLASDLIKNVEGM